MFPLFSIIIAFSIALAYPAVVPGTPEVDLLGVGITIGVALLVFRGVSGAAARKASAEPDVGLAAVVRAAALLKVANVVFFAVILYVFHWPGVIRALGVGDWILVDELILLAPFFLLLTFSILAGYRTEHAHEMHDFRVGRYLGFQLRNYLLPILPVCCFILVQDGMNAGTRGGIRWIAEVRILYSFYPFVQWLSLAVMLFALYCFTPFLLKWFWRAKSMPPGPLRDRLDRFSEREGFKARDILVWPTDRNILNAAVIGVAGPVRYVLMTDALIEDLPEEEVEAVFAHEVGHAKHRHLLLFFLFTVSYALLAYLLAVLVQGPIANAIQNQAIVAVVLGLGGFMVWFGILFGFVSRRFEQQADVYGLLATGRGYGDRSFPPAEHPFVRALEGIGISMGDLREAKGWRHFSLGDRISFLLAFQSDGGVQKTYRRSMTALLAFFFGLLIALGVAAAATIPGQIEEGRIPASQARAAWLIDHGYESAAVRETEARIRQVVSELRRQAMRAHDTLMVESETPLTDGVLAVPVLAPGDRARLRLELAIAYRELGMLRAARLTLEEILAELGNQPAILILIGDVLQREGRRGGAALAFRDALRRIPADHPEAAGLRSRLEALGAD